MWRCLVSVVTACLSSFVLFVLLLLMHRGFVAAIQITSRGQASEDSVYYSSCILFAMEIVAFLLVYLYMYKRKHMWIGPNEKEKHYIFVFMLVGFAATFIYLFKYAVIIYGQLSNIFFEELSVWLSPVELIGIWGLGLLVIWAVIVMGRHYPNRSSLSGDTSRGHW